MTSRVSHHLIVSVCTVTDCSKTLVYFSCVFALFVDYNYSLSVLNSFESRIRPLLCLFSIMAMNRSKDKLKLGKDKTHLLWLCLSNCTVPNGDYNLSKYYETKLDYNKQRGENQLKSIHPASYEIHKPQPCVSTSTFNTSIHWWCIK